jgi:hypothetical protein
MLSDIKKWVKSARAAVDMAAETMSAPESTRDTAAKETWQNELNKLAQTIETARKRRRRESGGRVPVVR